MRPLAARTTSLLCAAALAAGCGVGARSPNAHSDDATFSENVQLDPQDAPDAHEDRNSGRTISGVYSAQSPEAPVVAVTFVFTADGTYTRSQTLGQGRSTRTDAGTYLVDDAGNLVLFVEQRGDARLAWAQRTSYRLTGDLAQSMTLTASDARSETFVRTGDAPANVPGAATAQ